MLEVKAFSKSFYYILCIYIEVNFQVNSIYYFLCIRAMDSNIIVTFNTACNWNASFR